MPDTPRIRRGPTRPASAIVALVALAWGTTGCEGSGERPLLPPRPGSHVVVISFDALRPDALGVYGRALDVSPHIDAFAREAILFENAYSVAPKTPTSFAAFFTGRHPARVFRDWRLADVPTVAELFRDAGYRTAAFVNNPQLAPARGFGRGFQHYRVLPAVDDARILDEVIAWLERQGDERLFVWVHWIDPHAPWEARADSAHLYRDDYAGPYRQRAAQLLVVEDPEELARVRSLYDGEIHAADRLFGRLIEALRRLGLYDDAIVVATSDHGEEFMEHGHVQHGWLTEENVRIPLLIRQPDVSAPERVALRVSNLDLLPMLAAAAGLDLPPGLEGRPPTRGTAARAPLAFVANTDARILAASILEDDTKLIVHCGRRNDRELYDLASDPGEQSNLAAEPDHHSRITALEQLLWQRLGVSRCEDLAMDRGEAPASAERRDLEPAQLEALRELGYLDDDGD